MLALYLHNCWTKGLKSWFWLKGRMEHLYGATVAGKLKYWTRNKSSSIKRNSTRIRPWFLLWNQPTVLCSSPCRVWNECSKIEYMIRPMPKDGSITLGTISSTVGKQRQLFSHKNKILFYYPALTSGLVSPLTMQSLLEPLHTDHVFGQFECFPLCLKAELSADIMTTTTSPN